MRLRTMNSLTPIRRGLGITAGLDPALARDLAVRCEDLGYHSLWSNDEPASPGLQMLAHFAAGAPQLELGVGVLPVDRHEPAHIASEISRLGLDPAKLWIGVGSGQLRAPMDRMRRAVSELRDLLPDTTRIVLAAMRPRLCALGGAIADAVLLNWMLPAQAAEARRWVQEGATKAGRAAADRRRLCPRRHWARLAATAPGRGKQVPQHQRGPSPALQCHGRSTRQRRRRRSDPSRGTRRTRAVPRRTRPTDRTTGRRPRPNLAIHGGSRRRTLRQAH